MKREKSKIKFSKKKKKGKKNLLEQIKDKNSSSNFKFFLNPKPQIFNSNFSFPSLKFHILNSQFSN